MKQDEQMFLVKVFLVCDSEPWSTELPVRIDLNRQSVRPRDLINSEGFNIVPKRADYLLNKWKRKGWYDHNADMGLDLGWLTPKGIEEAKKLVDIDSISVTKASDIL